MLLVVADMLFCIGAEAGTVRFAGADLMRVGVGGTEYVELAGVVAAAGGRWWSVAGSFVAVVPGRSGENVEWVFWADSLSAHIAGAIVRLVEPCREREGRLFVPLSALGLLSGSRPEGIVRSLRAWCQAETVFMEVAVESSGSQAGGSVVTRQEQVSSLEFRVTLAARPDSGLARGLASFTAQTRGLVRRVDIDTSGSTVLNFCFERPMRVEENSARAAVTGFGWKAWPRPSREIKRVVLDPGHGGADPGAVSRRGTLEKTVVLDVARRVKKKLERAGLEVVLTRSSDASVSLAERTRLGNGQRAMTPERNAGDDLFVSIHANASPNRGACGFETYFLSEAKTDWERAVAARENAAFDLTVAGDGNSADDVGLILADLAQNEFLWESSELAARIQEATAPQARVMDRGVRQAGFYVLRNTFMPAVLVECGFLSNQSEDKLLRTEAHRERLAEGISRGILAFVQTYRTGKQTGADRGR